MIYINTNILEIHLYPDPFYSTDLEQTESHPRKHPILFLSVAPSIKTEAREEGTKWRLDKIFVSFDIP